MANEVNIQINVDTKDTKKAAQDFVLMGKSLETMYRDGKISSKQLQAAVAQYREELVTTLPVTKATINANQSLQHIANRAKLEFKSLATETVTMRDQMRAMFQEQRVGNRVMAEMAQSFRGFGGLIGGPEISGSFTSLINNFQQLEFSVNSVGIAAQSSGGKVAALGKNLLSMGSAFIAPAALLVSQFMLIKDAIDKTREAIDKYRAAAIKAGILNEREQLAKEYGKITPRFQGIKAEYIQGLVAQFPWLAALLPAAYSGAEAERMGIRAQMQPGVNLGGGVHTAGIVLGEETITAKRYQPEWVNRYAMGRLQGTPMGRLNRGIAGGGKIAMGVEGPGTIGTDFADVEKMQRNIVSLGGVLRDSLTQGFQLGFANGESVLKTFTQSVLASIASIAAQQAAIAGVSGLLSLIPGVGTFGAIAGALGGLFGASSTSPVSGMDVTNGAGGLAGEMRNVANAVKGLELRVDNQGMYMSYERGKAAFERS